jgi:DNA polymerase-3 subunit delta
VPTFKAAYLIYGDDHGRVAERRARLRAMAETESGSSGVEVYEREACTPDAVAGALTALTFALGRRFVIADGVERWKDAQVAPVAAALAEIEQATTTVAFFGREEGRTTVPAALHEAVKRVGGQIACESTVKPWELPKWVAARARELGVELEAGAAKALVSQVGERQQRLLRELEKLAIEHGQGAAVSIEDVGASCAASAERKVWTLADAIVAGDRRAALRILLELRGQGERVTGLQYTIARRLREALAVATALAEGQPAAQVRRTLRMPSKAAERFIADVAARDVEAFRRGVALMADLELETRGGSGGVLGEDTAAVVALDAAAAA